MEAVAAFFDFLQFVSDWMTGNSPDGGLTGWWKKAVTWMVAEFFILWIRGKIWALTVGWDAAKLIINQLNVSGLLNNAWNLLPSDIASAGRYFQIPWAINFILQCYVTRLVIRVVF